MEQGVVRAFRRAASALAQAGYGPVEIMKGIHMANACRINMA